MLWIRQKHWTYSFYFKHFYLTILSETAPEDTQGRIHKKKLSLIFLIKAFSHTERVEVMDWESIIETCQASIHWIRCCCFFLRGQCSAFSISFGCLASLLLCHLWVDFWLFWWSLCHKVLPVYPRDLTWWITFILGQTFQSRQREGWIYCLKKN